MKPKRKLKRLKFNTPEEKRAYNRAYARYGRKLREFEKQFKETPIWKLEKPTIIPKTISEPPVKKARKIIIKPDGSVEIEL